MGCGGGGAGGWTDYEHRRCGISTGGGGIRSIPLPAQRPTRRDINSKRVDCDESVRLTSGEKKTGTVIKCGEVVNRSAASLAAVTIKPASFDGRGLERLDRTAQEATEPGRQTV